MPRKKNNLIIILKTLVVNTMVLVCVILYCTSKGVAEGLMSIPLEYDHAITKVRIVLDY